jgi:hypothetical protein
MNPTRDGLFAWQMISHKLLRYGSFVPMITLALAALYLVPRAGIFLLAALWYFAFVALAWQGHKKEASGESLTAIYSIPYYFMLLNFASYKACVAFFKGEKKVIWNPRKG